MGQSRHPQGKWNVAWSFQLSGCRGLVVVEVEVVHLEWTHAVECWLVRLSQQQQVEVSHPRAGACRCASGSPRSGGLRGHGDAVPCDVNCISGSGRCGPIFPGRDGKS